MKGEILFDFPSADWIRLWMVKLPWWVVKALEQLPDDYEGIITLNCFKGGLADVTWTPRPGETRREARATAPRNS
jgi:hypothetical protein